MTRSPILISGCAAPHVPTRRKVCTPSSLSSSTAIATDGPPMPVDIVDTFTPSSAPVKVRYSRLNATSRALSRYSAIFGVRNGSPGTSTYSPTSPGPRPTWYFFCSVFIVRPARARRQPPKRSLSAARDAVLVHAREYVGRLTNLALGQSPGTAESGRHPVDKLLRARVNGDERVTAPHPSSDGSLDDEARRGIDPVFLAHAARAQLERGEAYLQRIDRRFAPSPSVTISDASSSADATSGMNAPRPNFTSRTMASAPAAIFFDITLEAMRGIEGTVAVTSRSAYSSLSAGTMRGDCAATARPTSRTCWMNRSGSRSTVTPGTDSSLSSVPPVCARARPLSFGTFTPQAAANGPATSVTLSPTPPVECLSTLTPSIALRSRTSPLATIASVSARVSAAVMPRMQTAISHAAIWYSGISPRR